MALLIVAAVLALVLYVGRLNRKRFCLDPNLARREIKVTPAEYYHQVWQLVRDNALEQEKMGEWASFEHKFDGRLRTFHQAGLAVREALKALGDRYAFLLDYYEKRWWDGLSARKGVVSYRLLPGNIGYVRLTTFMSDHAVAEMKQALTALASADGYVFDLRGNLGGSLNVALKILSLFLDDGELTMLKGMRGGKPYTDSYELTAKAIVKVADGIASEIPREPNLTGMKPVVVLLNKMSASASELVAGALGDLGRAELLGTPTYGKGIVQWPFDLVGGTCLRLTISRYYLPGGDCVDGIGVHPDYLVVQSAGDGQLLAAVSLVKRQQIAPLPVPA